MWSEEGASREQLKCSNHYTHAAKTDYKSKDKVRRDEQVLKIR
jgi:hypothetical protein